MSEKTSPRRVSIIQRPFVWQTKDKISVEMRDIFLIVDEEKSTDNKVVFKKVDADYIIGKRDITKEEVVRTVKHIYEFVDSYAKLFIARALKDQENK
jgi:hypothetical protein